MENSICEIIPQKKHNNNLKIISFVYETNHKRLKQPERHSTYHMYVVTNGIAVLKKTEREYSLSAGSVFLTFPGEFYDLCGNENFRYAYINFSGDSVAEILADLAIFKSTPVCNGFDELLDFWLTAFSKINPANATVLTEGILMYTLSLINTRNILAKPMPNDANIYHMIVDYIDNNFSIATLSLTMVANVFSYSEKYISYIFKKNKKVGFSTYVQDLRINHAVELIKDNHFSVKEIAHLCGFTDPLYFSKVFKKKTGLSPKEYRTTFLKEK